VTNQTIGSFLIGSSREMTRVRELIARVAPLNLPVLIEGPTGSGKELVALGLHRASGRAGCFVPVNVCALAEAMFDDALFGHVRGAFTGALGNHAGFLLEAHRGTIFLDEISSMPLYAQAKLLRAIETREFRPIGARCDSMSDFRLVAATNVPLETLTSQHAFREDLKYRLTGLVIRLPSLDSHREDIPELARHFASMTSTTHGERVEFSEAALAALIDRSWPGNVRELRHAVEQVIAFAHGGHVGRNEIASLLAEKAPSRLSCVQDFERRRLHDLLEESKWDIRRVAVLLGVHRGSVYRRMKHFGIPSPQRHRTLETYDEASRAIRMRQRATSRDLPTPANSEVIESV
jgi:two-component system response regulator HydG